MALDEAISSEHDGDSYGFHYSGFDLRNCDFDGSSLDLVLDEEKCEIF